VKHTDVCRILFKSFLKTDLIRKVKTNWNYFFIHVSLIHHQCKSDLIYLRTDIVDRDRIFASAKDIEAFIRRRDLNGSNEALRSRTEAIHDILLGKSWWANPGVYEVPRSSAPAGPWLASCAAPNEGRERGYNTSFHGTPEVIEAAA
jgi:hypothetical protein